MDKETVKGGLKKASGTVKEKAGQLVGDRHTEAEGKAEKAEGRARSAVGHAKDAVREVVGKK
ncbi:MAG: CsbD family protein [Thiohalocapsa sp.]